TIGGSSLARGPRLAGPTDVRRLEATARLRQRVIGRRVCRVRSFGLDLVVLTSPEPAQHVEIQRFLREVRIARRPSSVRRSPPWVFDVPQECRRPLRPLYLCFRLSLGLSKEELPRISSDLISVEFLQLHLDETFFLISPTACGQAFSHIAVN